MHRSRVEQVQDLKDMGIKPAKGHPAYTSVEFVSSKEAETRAAAARTQALTSVPVQQEMFTMKDFDRAVVTSSRPDIPDMSTRPSPVSGYGELEQK